MKLIKDTNRIIFILLLAIIATFVPTNAIANEPIPSIAPLNPEFLDYLEFINQIKGNELKGFENKDIQKGLIPRTHSITRSSRENFNDVYNAPYPSSFDLRDYDRVTAVKDQGPNGSCWAFAAYSSVESYLKSNELRTWDFSERNMRNNHGFDWKYDDGGNSDMASAYLARWEGPVLESDDPYDPYNPISPKNLPIQKHLSDVLYIPDRTSSLDNELIKHALMEYGAVETSYFDDDNYYKLNMSAYYYNGPTKDIYSNHAVSIIGWDDNYSASNFKGTPPGNGAFIVKNSWGDWWGQDGYFYISYYDKYVGKDNAVYITQDMDPEFCSKIEEKTALDPWKC